MSNSQNLAQFVNQLAGKNRIINGVMAVDQRNNGSAQTITAAAALAYTVDRWWAACTGANVAGQQGINAYVFSGAASVTGIQFGQRIEAKNSSDLAGTTATLSVNLANGLLTTVTWTAYYANTSDTFGTLASPTKTQIATGTFNVTSTLTRYNTQIAIPSAATTGIEVVFSVGAQISGTWTIGGVQLEVGNKATQFERLPYGMTLALCGRYYQVLTGLINGAYVPSASVNFGQTYPIPPMRATPTVSLSGAAYVNASGITNQTGLGTATIYVYATSTASGMVNYTGVTATLSAEL